MVLLKLALHLTIITCAALSCVEWSFCLMATPPGASCIASSIPSVVWAGYRAVAPDMIGFGRCGVGRTRVELRYHDDFFSGEESL